MNSDKLENTEMKPVPFKTLDKEDSGDRKSIPIHVLESDSIKMTEKNVVENIHEDEIDKLYQENEHYLNTIGTSIDDDHPIDKDNDEYQVEKLYKENKHFLSNVMCNKGDFDDQLPNKEFVEMNEQVDSYMLQEKVYDKLYGNDNVDIIDDRSISTDIRTDIGSVRGFLGNIVSQRHYYMLIQNNNTLLNDAQQFRNRLVEKLTAIETQIQDLQSSSENNSSKSKFVKRFFTYRKEYFIDEDLFPCPGNTDKRKIERMNVIPTYVPHGTRWIMSHMEKLKKEIASHLLFKKTGTLKKMKAQMSRSKPNAKILEDYSKNEKEMDILQQLPNEEIPLLVKDVSIDWEYISVKVRPESTESANKTSDDCRKMWQLCLAPTVNQKPWSEEEDKKLERLATKNHKEDWDSIAKKLETQRTGFQCFTHYQLRNPQDSGIPWTKREDVLLLSHLYKHKNTNLKSGTLMAIILFLRKRSFGEIRRRLCKLKDSTMSLTTHIKKGPFTEWEVKVMETCIKQGLNFKTIANLLGHRTHAQVRDKLSRKYDDRLPANQKRKGLFTLDEDKRLMNLTVKYGIKSWSFIAKKMKTRDRTQCRHRYNCIIANLKRGTEFKKKFRRKDKEDTNAAANTDTCDDTESSLDSMLELMKKEPPSKKHHPRSRSIGPKPYGKKFQIHSDADNLIQEYFAYASHVPRCTQAAIKQDVMEKSYTGDALQATLNYLQMQLDPDLLISRGDVSHEDVSEYWNLADYPHMIRWYRNYEAEQKKIRRLNLSGSDDTGGPSVCEDIDLELPFCYLSNRYTMSSLLHSDLDFYKSNLVHEPIRSKNTHARLVINNNGASTCNTSRDASHQQDSSSQYYFPPSAATLKALQNYKKFQENSVNKDEVVFDFHAEPNVKETEEGDAAKRLFQTRLQNLFTASYLLVRSISEGTDGPNIDWLLIEDDELPGVSNQTAEPVHS